MTDTIVCSGRNLTPGRIRMHVVRIHPSLTPPVNCICQIVVLPRWVGRYMLTTSIKWTDSQNDQLWPASQSIICLNRLRESGKQKTYQSYTQLISEVVHGWSNQPPPLVRKMPSRLFSVSYTHLTLPTTPYV